jgi:hypothetical protein
MFTLLSIVLVLSGVYAIFGNIAIYFILVRRGIPVRTIWAGTPTYLYRICVKASPPVGQRLRRFAFSTDVAFLVAMLMGILLSPLM